MPAAEEFHPGLPRLEIDVIDLLVGRVVPSARGWAGRAGDPISFVLQYCTVQ